MKINKLPWLLGLVFAASTCLAQMYTVTDLGKPGMTEQTGNAINNFGQVAGYYYDENLEARGFLYSDDKLTQLDIFSDTFAYGINDSGRIVGSFYPPPFTFKHAFLYRNGALKDLGTLGGPSGTSEAFGINACGRITGYTSLPGGNLHAFLYSDGTMTDIGDLGGGGSVGAAINDLGEITGSAGHAFLYSAGQMKDLGALGPFGSSGRAINVFGQVTGITSTQSTGVYHAFLYSNGTMNDIDTLGSDYSVGLGINAWGEVTGEARYLGPFVYSDGKMQNLNALIPANSGWSLGSGTAINNAGQITGYGLTASGIHAFLLTPIYKAFVQRPINPDGSSVFSSKRGTVVAKFTLKKSNLRTCELWPATIAVTKIAGAAFETLDPNSYMTNSDDGPNFRVNDCKYVYNLAAASLGVGTYRVDISIHGIMVGHAVFALK